MRFWKLFESTAVTAFRGGRGGTEAVRGVTLGAPAPVHDRRSILGQRGVFCKPFTRPPHGGRGQSAHPTRNPPTAGGRPARGGCGSTARAPSTRKTGPR